METARLSDASETSWIGRPTHDELRRGERPRTPGKDPFYLPPAGFQHAAPGTVLRTREVELAFLGRIPQQFTAMQLLYRTSDMNGVPEAAVTTVVVPAERDVHKPCPVVSYQCAIDAVSSRCFPSYALRRGAHALGALPQLEFLLVAAALAEGWAVSVPDHEGVNGWWGAPVEPGYRILDGLRAVVQCDRLGLAPSSPIGLWGYSGGGLASAWAAEMAAGYAPELDIVGAVLGSPVGDLGNTFKRLNGTFFSGLPALVVAALTHVYPELDEVLERHATEKGRSLLYSLERMTTIPAVIRMAFKDMDSYVDRPLQEILDEPAVRQVFDNIRLGVTAPTPPVLLVQAVHDKIVSVDDIDTLAETYLAGGSRLTYHRDKFSEHMLLHPMSAPMTLRWLRDRFAGKPLSENMVRTTWPTLLNPSAYQGMLRLGLIAARIVTGRPLHRKPLSTLDMPDA